MRLTVSVRRGGFLCAPFHLSFAHEIRTSNGRVKYSTAAMFQPAMSALNAYAFFTITQAHTVYSITAYNEYR